ncbi:MAG: HNH endonuclease [Proteobacteria bacterium]|nr:HNH endonuclease [Pseudomonadota bacterium]
MNSSKKCKDCERIFPETREFFGQYKNNRNGIIKIAFRNSCRECMAKNTQKHYVEKPDLLKKRLEKRKTLEHNATGDYSKADIEKIRINLDDKCFFCSKELNNTGEIEHLKPISRGGSNDPKNLTLSCLNCNREKTNKTLNEYINWRQERGLITRDMAILQNSSQI